MTTLVVAAGGGGDALDSLLLRRLLPETTQAPLIATFAWERLRIDPAPGPRGAAGFTGLRDTDGLDMEIVMATDTIPPGRSSLPRLARETDARLFLLDPCGGAAGVSTQLSHLTTSLDVNRLAVVDVGGDVIARGDALSDRLL